MVVQSVKFVKTGIPRLEVYTHSGHSVQVSFVRGMENARHVEEPASVEMVSRNAQLMPHVQRAILEHLVKQQRKSFTLPEGFFKALQLAHERSAASPSERRRVA